MNRPSMTRRTDIWLPRIPRFAAFAEALYLLCGIGSFWANAKRVSLGYVADALRDTAWTTHYARAEWMEHAFFRMFFDIPIFLILPLLLTQFFLLIRSPPSFDRRTRAWLVWTTIVATVIAIVTVLLGLLPGGGGLIG